MLGHSVVEEGAVGHGEGLVGGGAWRGDLRLYNCNQTHHALVAIKGSYPILEIEAYSSLKLSKKPRFG